MTIAAGGLERYRRAASANFLAKADIDLPDEDLETLARAKATFAVSAEDLLAAEIGSVLGEPPEAVERIRPVR